MPKSTKLLSIVIPVFNESHGLQNFHSSLTKELNSLEELDFEIIYCDDGSTDDTANIIQKLASGDSRVKLMSLSRNFGKEVAITAGIHQAQGDAVVTIDSDGQHPVELIPKFLEKWQSGSQVVIGLRTSNHREGFIKRYGSKIFYGLFNKFTGIKLVQGSTDFRLIDRAVQREFMRMNEHSRITRGLIDWLGYKRDYIQFQANARFAGESGYSFKKLVKLAVDSVISMSLSPLYLTVYIGGVILPFSAILGIGMLINALCGDVLNLHATGSAYAIVFLLFLVGILLVSQGIIGLYLSHIHIETQNRPLYVVDKARSIGLHDS